MASPHDSWIGREETVSSLIDPWPAQALRATLDLEAADAAPPPALPPLWSWLHFLDTPARATIGADGHPEKGGFMPPVEAPRRMFAGGRAEFLSPLRIGVPALQTRRILAVAQKAGGAGPLTFVTVGVETRQEGTLCVRETRDIVYLHPGPAAPAREPQPVPDAPWRHDLTPDPVLLARFSALTFNAHRIHYDLEYARDVEGYPERVVHGPLTAVLLAELARLQGGAALASFGFRARSPLFCGRAVHLRGTPNADGAALAAYDDRGALAMTAEATLA